MDHGGPARRDDHIGLLHQFERLVLGRVLDPADDVRGGSCSDGSVVNDSRGRDGARRGSWVRGEDDAVPGLETQQALKNGRRRRVRARYDAAQCSHWLGNLLDAGERIRVDDPHGLFVLVTVVYLLTRKVILDHFVLDEPDAGFLDGQLGEGDPVHVRRQRCLLEDDIDLRLRELGILELRRPRLGECFGDAGLEAATLGGGEELSFNGRGPLRADLVANLLDITLRRTDVSSEAGRSQMARQIAQRNSRVLISQGDRTDTGTQPIGRRVHDGMHRQAERGNSFVFVLHRFIPPATSPHLPGDAYRERQGR